VAQEVDADLAEAHSPLLQPPPPPPQAPVAAACRGQAARASRRRLSTTAAGERRQTPGQAGSRRGQARQGPKGGVPAEKPAVFSVGRRGSSPLSHRRRRCGGEQPGRLAHDGVCGRHWCRWRRRRRGRRPSHRGGRRGGECWRGRSGAAVTAVHSSLGRRPASPSLDAAGLRAKTAHLAQQTGLDLGLRRVRGSVLLWEVCEQRRSERSGVAAAAGQEGAAAAGGPHRAPGAPPPPARRTVTATAAAVPRPAFPVAVAGGGGRQRSVRLAAAPPGEPPAAWLRVAGAPADGGVLDVPLPPLLGGGEA
jgi:hypothetical protein